MAISATTVGEVRPATGNAANAGLFDPSLGGTDYSQQDSPQVTFNGTTITASIAGAGATITLSGVTADATWLGNVINITAGTGFTVGRYQITAQAGTTVTLDRNVSAGAASAMVGRMGGAVALLLTLATTIVSGNKVHYKGGSTETFGQNVTLTAGTAALPVVVEGYITTRGDIRTASYTAMHTSNGFLITTGWPTINTSTFVWTSNVNCLLIGFIVTSTKTSGNLITGNNCTHLYRMKFSATGAGTQMCITFGSAASARDCEFSTVGSSGNHGVTAGATGLFSNCRFTSTSGDGVSVGAIGVTFQSCTFYNFAASQIAIKGNVLNSVIFVQNCTFDGVAGTCVTMSNLAHTVPTTVLENNIVTNCGTFCENLRAGTSLYRIVSSNNRIRNTSNSYVGWYGSETQFDVTTAQTDAQEYVDRSSLDFRLIRTSASVDAGTTPGTDMGSNPRVESVMPTVANVTVGVQYGDGGTEFTGTLSVPSLANVRSGVIYVLGTGTLVVPAVGNVRSGTSFDNGSTGTLAVPSANDVRNGTSFDTASTGNLVVPAVGNVRAAVTFGSSSGLTGTLVVPAVGNVRNGTNFDTASTGTLVVPAVGNVRNGTNFDTASTGTLVVPSANDVRNGTSFDTASTGNLVVPVVGNVRAAITFGSSSNLTGTLVVPVVGNVRNGTAFDTASTGTLVVPVVGNVRSGTNFDTASTGTLVVPSVDDVRNGTNFDTASTGNLVVPVISNVRAAVTFGSSSGLTGTLVVPAEADVREATDFDTASTGTLAVPAVGNVRFSTVFDNGSTGTLVVPSVNNVRDGVNFDTASTGLIVVPDVGDVRSGVSFDVSSTGTLSIPTTPDEGDVRLGVTYGISGSDTGTLVLPSIGNVLSGVGFGEDGTEFTGTYVDGAGPTIDYPTESQVLAGVTFGNDSELTGTVVLPGVSDVRLGIDFGPSSNLTGTLIVTGGGGGGVSDGSFYDRMAQVAKRLIESKGRPLTLRKRSDVPMDANKPWRGATQAGDLVTVDVLGLIVPTGYAEDPVTGVRYATAKATIAALSANEEVAPSTFEEADLRDYDDIVDGDLVWAIKDVTSLKPGDVSLIWKLELRK